METRQETPLNAQEAPEAQASTNIYRAQIAVQVDDTLPRNQMVVTPHFHSTGGFPPDQLADQLAANTLAYLGTSAHVIVKVYLEDGIPGHHPPLGEATAGGTADVLVSNVPRELALCLSYYAGSNRPRTRGRLYIPVLWTQTTTVGKRPAAGDIADTMSFATTVLLPPASIQYMWCVWSTVDKVGTVVTTYWVDDEWDIQRRRGMRSTTRQSSNVP